MAGQQLSFSEIEQVWTQAGGSRAMAPLMAAIALAESGGNVESLNDDPGTGDYSVGLWQINYYGSLMQPRTARYGPPDALRTGPDAAVRNARAAVDLAQGGRGLGNWSTYTSGAYQHYYTGSVPQTPGTEPLRPGRPDAAAAGSRTATSAGGLLSGLSAGSWLNGLIPGVGSSLDFLKAALFLVQPRNWLRAVEFLAGSLLIGLGLVGLAVMFVQRSGVVGEAAGVATMLPGPAGAAGRAVTTVRATSTPLGRQSAAARAIPQRLHERAAVEHGRRQEQQHAQQRRQAAARAQGRKQQLGRIDDTLAARRARARNQEALDRFFNDDVSA